MYNVLNFLYFLLKLSYKTNDRVIYNSLRNLVNIFLHCVVFFQYDWSGECDTARDLKSSLKLWEIPSQVPINIRASCWQCIVFHSMILQSTYQKWASQITNTPLQIPSEKFQIQNLSSQIPSCEKSPLESWSTSMPPAGSNVSYFTMFHGSSPKGVM